MALSTGCAEDPGVVGVDDAGPTDMPISAHELPYESSPAKVAVIVYRLSAGGIHVALNVPLISLVTVPKSMVVPLALMANSLTGTPVIVSLCQTPSTGSCMCKYCI